jgi:hypothetical protein
MSTIHPDSMAPWPPARPAPAASGSPGRTPRLAALARRARDLFLMAAVGSAMGVIAIGAFEVAGRWQDRQRAEQREHDRALAALEDRPYVPGTAPPPPVLPIAPAAPSPIELGLARSVPTPAPEPWPQPVLAQADFHDVKPTRDARHMADWVVTRHDNGRLPFMVLDKRAARVYVFQPNGELVRDTPVLLGQSHGDDTYPGIGNVPISQVQPYQRTTAAGRFVTRPGLDEDRTDVVWLDYDAALAMHRVINKVKSEHRPWRLAQPSPKLRRISWGCINVPIPFFDQYISPVFGKRRGVVYVIPETKTFAQVFESGGGAPAAATTVADSTPVAPKAISDR